MKQVITVKVVGQPYRYTSTARQHTWGADAPAGKGGDTAPTPVEHLLGALGQCLAMTIEGSAQSRGWKVPDIRVTVEYEEIDDPSEAGKKVHRFIEHIELHGDLDQKQVDRLKAAALHCTVYKMMTGKKEFDSKVVLVKPAPAQPVVDEKSAPATADAPAATEQSTPAARQPAPAVEVAPVNTDKPATRQPSAPVVVAPVHTDKPAASVSAGATASNGGGCNT